MVQFKKLSILRRSKRENDEIMYHWRNLTTEGTSMYYPYGYIGFRKGCTTCPFYWTDHQPTQYTNWYGSDPNTYYYECTEMYITTTYNGQWLDYTCNGAINAFCQFYPKLQNPPVQPKKGIESSESDEVSENFFDRFY